MIDQRLLKLLGYIFQLLYVFSFILAAGIIIYLGIVYITAGKDEAIKKVHERWLFLLVGMILVFASLTIPSLIRKFFSP